MKFILLLLLFPIVTNAQSDTTIVYSQSYHVKGQDQQIINKYTQQFIAEQKGRFFYLYSYSKQGIDKSIDTSKYGYYTTTGDSIKTTCLFVYIAASVDIVEGDIIFTSKDHEANIKLQNVRYSKYEQHHGQWRETQRGYYKDLKLCKHCNVTGIKLAETVNKGFIRLSLAYGNFLKKAH